jgi:hypothetical protein
MGFEEPLGKGTMGTGRFDSVPIITALCSVTRNGTHG